MIISRPVIVASMELDPRPFPIVKEKEVHGRQIHWKSAVLIEEDHGLPQHQGAITKEKGHRQKQHVLSIPISPRRKLRPSVVQCPSQVTLQGGHRVKSELSIFLTRDVSRAAGVAQW